MIKETEVPAMYDIPDYTIDLEKGCYHGFFVKCDVNRNQEQTHMEAYPDEEDMEDTILDDEIEHRWKMVFEDNKEEVDDYKVILHTRKWDFYMSNKLSLITVGYYVEV